MKKILFIIIPILILTVAGIAFAVSNGGSTDSQTKGAMNMTDKKVLIAYFSWGGNTKHIAELIQSKTNADIFRIETKTPYPDDYNTTAYGIAKEQHEKNIHPEMKENIDISNYDVIFVGTPAWWHTMAPVVMTFLESNNFEGKTIVPFITHGGGGEYTIAEDMGKLAKGAKVLHPLVIYEKGNSETDKEITEWLKQIK